MHHARYIIVGCSRSGSTAVHVAIRGHPNVAAREGEMSIAPFFSQGLDMYTDSCAPQDVQQRARLALFDALSLAEADAKTTHCGIKVCAQSPWQADVIVDALRRYMPEMKVILTIREDLVAQYASLRKAMSSKIWHSWSLNADRERERTIHLKPWSFRRYARKCLYVMSTLGQLKESHETYECNYEDLLSDPNRIYGELFDRLGLPQVEVTWQTSRKLNPSPSQYVRNYEQISRLFRDLRGQVPHHRLPWHARGPNYLVERVSRCFHPRTKEM